MESSSTACDTTCQRLVTVIWQPKSWVTVSRLTCAGEVANTVPLRNGKAAVPLEETQHIRTRIRDPRNKLVLTEFPLVVLKLTPFHRKT